MMIVSIITLIFSCLVQGTISNYLGYNYTNLTIFFSIYILVNLLVLKPHFESEKKYLILLIIFGFLMDTAYTNTFVLNICLFFMVYYISKVFHTFFPYNFITINISTLLSIFMYHIMTFCFLKMLNYDQYSLAMLWKVLTHSIIMTIIYTSLLYGILNYITQKWNLKEVK